MCTESADEAVIVEGDAQPVADATMPSALGPAYLEKYGTPYPEDSVYVVRPRVVFGFIEDAAEFPGTATRWKFPDR